MIVSTRIRAAVALMITGVLGGIAPLLMKYAFSEFAPMQIVYLRFLLAVILTLPLLAVHATKIKPNLSILFPAGLLFSGNVFFVIVGLMTTTSIISQLFYLLSPVIVSGVGYFIFHERVSTRRIMSMVICFISASLILMRSVNAHDLVQSIGTFQGNVFVLLAVISWSLYLIVTKRTGTKLEPSLFLVVNFIVTFFMSILFLFFQGVSPIQTLYQFFKSNISVQLSIVALGSINSVFFFFLYQWSIKKVSAFMVSAAAYLSPLSAATFGIPFFGERLSITLIMSAVGIFIGSYLIVTEKRK